MPRRKSKSLNRYREDGFHADLSATLLDGSVQDLTVEVMELKKLVNSLTKKFRTMVNAEQDDREERLREVSEIRRLARLCCSQQDDRQQDRESESERDFEKLTIPTKTVFHSWSVLNKVGTKYPRLGVTIDYFTVPHVEPTGNRTVLSEGPIEIKGDDEEQIGPSQEEGELETGQEPDLESDIFGELIGVGFTSDEAFDIMSGAVSYAFYSVLTEYVHVTRVVVWTYNQTDFYNGKYEISTGDCYQTQDYYYEIDGYANTPVLYYGPDSGVRELTDEQLSICRKVAKFGGYPTLILHSFVESVETEHVDSTMWNFQGPPRVNGGSDVDSMQGMGGWGTSDIFEPSPFGSSIIDEDLNSMEFPLVSGASSSNQEVTTLPEYDESVLPNSSVSGNIQKPKSDSPSWAGTRVYSSKGDIIWESEGRYDLEGVLLNSDLTKSEIGSIYNASNTKKPYRIY